jgi:hypothetical protein
MDGPFNCHNKIWVEIFDISGHLSILTKIVTLKSVYFSFLQLIPFRELKITNRTLEKLHQGIIQHLIGKLH